MKTAEEWYDEKEMCGDEDADGNLLPYEFTPDDFRAIQLDAMKEGMRRAAAINEQYMPALMSKDANRAISSAAEQLTEKDLCSAPHVTNPSKQKE